MGKKFLPVKKGPMNKAPREIFSRVITFILALCALGSSASAQSTSAVFKDVRNSAISAYFVPEIRANGDTISGASLFACGSGLALVTQLGRVYSFDLLGHVISQSTVPGFGTTSVGSSNTLHSVFTFAGQCDQDGVLYVAVAVPAGQTYLTTIYRYAGGAFTPINLPAGFSVAMDPEYFARSEPGLDALGNLWVGVHQDSLSYSDVSSYSVARITPDGESVRILQGVAAAHFVQGTNGAVYMSVGKANSLLANNEAASPYQYQLFKILPDLTVERISIKNPAEYLFANRYGDVGYAFHQSGYYGICYGSLPRNGAISEFCLPHYSVSLFGDTFLSSTGSFWHLLGIIQSIVKPGGLARAIYSYHSIEDFGHRGIDVGPFLGAEGPDGRIWFISLALRSNDISIHENCLYSIKKEPPDLQFRYGNVAVKDNGKVRLNLYVKNAYKYTSATQVPFTFYTSKSSSFTASAKKIALKRVDLTTGSPTVPNKISLELKKKLTGLHLFSCIDCTDWMSVAELKARTRRLR